MAISEAITLLLFVCALSSTHLSGAQLIKAKLTCLDCTTKTDLSGIKVLVKCDQVKQLVSARTEADGSFQAQIPSDDAAQPRSATPLNCLVKLLGGPDQLYASKRSMASPVVETLDRSNTYTLSSALSFYSSCPSTLGLATCESMQRFGASKTIDLPLPHEWGLAPSSLYFPFFPIIGIP